MLASDAADRKQCFSMKKSNKKPRPSVVVDANTFVTAQQASAMLNLPLYYFINPAKRHSMGVPHYFINRMVRYRLGELHRWQVSLAHRQGQAERSSVPSPRSEVGVVGA